MIMVGDVAVGLTTCYDVRFPGLYTTLAERGAQITCVAASWGAGPGKVDQWRLLTRARALDSTTFVVAAGQADPAADRRGAARERAHRDRPQRGHLPARRGAGRAGSGTGAARHRARPGPGGDGPSRDPGARQPQVLRAETSIAGAPAVEYCAHVGGSAVVAVPGPGLVEPAGRPAGPRSASRPTTRRRRAAGGRR